MQKSTLTIQRAERIMMVDISSEKDYKQEIKVPAENRPPLLLTVHITKFHASCAYSQIDSIMINRL
jgi:hypothetical protein